MKIIGCYIVKNEAEALQRSLRGLHGQVDEIVVVDTGSTDDTLPIAEKAGAIIHHFPWQNDFSAARNFALEQLTGDWVVFLDADEYFTQETAGNLRTLLEAQSIDTNLLLVRRQDVDEEGRLMMSLYVPRIFRIRSDLRYTGAIHEELRQAGRPVTGIAAVVEHDLLLIHTGYAGKLGKAKAQRNIEMLLREMEHSEEPGRLYGYLAEAYDGLEDRENAMKYAYLDIARGRQAETYASRSYRLLLEKLAENKRDYEERQRIARMAVRDFPELPEFHAELAESLAAGWQYEEATTQMQKACETGEMKPGLEPSLFNDGMAETCRQRAELFARLAQEARTVKITACVIVKNEEKNITEWLKNAQVYANQCLVLDTGSTDKTCELALEAGAELHHYVWQDDFAAARNEALKYVRGEWVAFLDADEFFSNPEAVRGFLAESTVFHPQAEAVRVTIQNVDADDGMREISRFCNIRLFKNKPHLRYQGNVHENLQNISHSAPLEVWEEPRMVVVHTGYSSSIILQKSHRNLNLLQQDIARNGEQPRHYRYLADCYYALGDYQQAEIYALKAVDAPLKGVGTQGDMYYMVLLCMKALEEPTMDQLAFAEAAGRAFPAVPDFPAVQGILHFQLGNYSLAGDLLTEACRLEETSDGRESCSFGDIKAASYAAKAYCEWKRNNRDQALQGSRQAMDINPGEELALEVFCDIRQDMEAQELAKDLRSYFDDNGQNLSFLCRFCERNGFGGLYSYYCGQLQARYGKEILRQEYYQLLEAGDWPALVDKLKTGLAADVDAAIELLCRLERMEGNAFRQAERQLLNLLPSEVQALWKAIANGEAAANWASYKTLWPYILSYGDREQISRFTALALGRPDIWRNFVRDMLHWEKWQEAFDLLAKVPQDLADGDFWQAAGRCLYHLGDYQAAEEALAKVRELGQETPMLKSYEKWIKNKKST